MPQTKSEETATGATVVHSFSVNKFARLLEGMGFVAQHMQGDNGMPAVRFMKLGIDGLALFFAHGGDDQFKIVVLNAYLAGAQPLEVVNGVNSRGILPKVYTRPDNTVIELCIPVEAGLTLDAVAYYVTAFETTLRNVATPVPPGRGK